MFGRRFSVSEGSNAFEMNYTDLDEQHIAEDYGLERVQRRINLMKQIRKPGYDLGFVLLMALVYLGILVAVIILRDYVFTPNESD